MRKQYDILLHLLSRHTNLQIPFSDYVKSKEFPKQISELLNTEVTIRYRDFSITDLDTEKRAAVIIKNGEKISSRPNDDNQQLEDRESDLYEIEERPYAYKGKFRILRADSTEPYRLIAISEDYSKIIVNSTKKDENDEYEFLSLVSEYPIQMNEYIGLGCYDQYAGEIPEIKAATLRVDKCEPCYSILMEFLGSTGVVRFILGDEAISKLYDYFDISGSRDYDNRHANDEENPVDITGEHADADTHGYKFNDVNGGYSNNWDKMYDRNIIMTDEEIINFRKSILEGKTIYGTD